MVSARIQHALFEMNAGFRPAPYAIAALVVDVPGAEQAEQAGLVRTVTSLRDAVCKPPPKGPAATGELTAGPGPATGTGPGSAKRSGPGGKSPDRAQHQPV